jgi:hypothetical protein
MVCMCPRQRWVNLKWLSIHDYVQVWRHSGRHVRRAKPLLVGGAVRGKENNISQMEGLIMIEEAVHLNEDLSPKGRNKDE